MSEQETVESVEDPVKDALGAGLEAQLRVLARSILGARFDCLKQGSANYSLWIVSAQCLLL